jgi:alpha-tubulin suppressor-like RCC1 family protein
MTLMEATLRRRAQARGRSLPVSLPKGVGRWVDFLIFLELRDDAEHHGIGARDEHSFFVDESGTLLCCGRQAACYSGTLVLGDLYGGVSGVGADDDSDDEMVQVDRPHPIPSVQGVRMRGVSAGQDHSLAVSEGGVVYSWGSKSNLASMLLTDREPRLVPTVVEPLRGIRMRMVAAGAAHCVALSEDGVVFTWGDANATRRVDDETAVLGYCELYGPGLGRKVEVGADRVPQPVAALAGVRIATVAAGESFALAMSETGAVFSFGKGKSGRLGHGDKLDVELPKQIEALRGVCVLTVAAGGAHALALTHTGAVYSWGFGRSGQLGHGRRSTTTTPAVVEALRGVRVNYIAAGGIHSCAASRPEGLYMWGSGSEGQLGHGTHADESRPTRVEAAWGRSFLGLWAGCDHPFALTGEGTLLAFGRGIAAAVPTTQGAEFESGDQVFNITTDEHYQMVPADLGDIVRVKLP